MSMPVWIAEVQAFSTPLIAAGAGLIAYQQFRVAHRKLRLDLFQKRYAILEIFRRNVVTALNQAASATFDQETAEMNEQLNVARFLIDRKVFDYLNEVATRVLQVRHSTITLRNSQPFDGMQEFISMHNQGVKMLLDDLKKMPVCMAPFLMVDDKLSLSMKPGSDIPSLIPRSGRLVAESVPSTGNHAKETPR